MTIQPSAKSEGRVELILLLVAFVVANIASEFLQPPTVYNDGKGTDGVFSFKVAEQLSHGQRPTAEAPFVYRIGTPLLVSLFFRSNLLQGFKVVNIVANAVTTVLLILFLRLYLASWRLRLLLALLFITQWHAPIRLLYFCPVYTDPWLFPFLLAGLLAIERTQTGSGVGPVLFLALASFVGCLFRENTALVPIALLFASNPIQHRAKPVKCRATVDGSETVKRSSLTLALPLVCAVLGFGVARWVGVPTNDYSFARAAFDWAYNKVFLTYLHAWFIAFGPVLAIAIYNWRRNAAFLLNHQHLLVYLIIIVLLAWVGGSSTERYLYWAMPVLYVVVGKSIEHNLPLLRSPLLLAILITSQLVSQRVFWILPDLSTSSSSPLPLLTVPGNRFRLLDLFSCHANRHIQAVSLLQYVLLESVLVWWLHRRARSNGLAA
jgi:hypothetical protein